MGVITGGVVSPGCQTTAWVSPVAVLLNPTTRLLAFIATAKLSLPPSVSRSRRPPAAVQ